MKYKLNNTRKKTKYYLHESKEIAMSSELYCNVYTFISCQAITPTIVSMTYTGHSETVNKMMRQNDTSS